MKIIKTNHEENIAQVCINAICCSAGAVMQLPIYQYQHTQRRVYSCLLSLCGAIITLIIHKITTA